MERKKRGWRFFTSGYLVLVLAFIYLPIFYLMLFSFNDSKSMISFSGFSLRWYHELLENREMLQSIWYTVLVALIATGVSTVIGPVAAIGLSKARPLLRNPDAAVPEHEGAAEHCYFNPCAHYLLYALCDPDRAAEAAAAG